MSKTYPSQSSSERVGAHQTRQARLESRTFIASVVSEKYADFDGPLQIPRRPSTPPSPPLSIIVYCLCFFGSHHLQKRNQVRDQAPSVEVAVVSAHQNRGNAHQAGGVEGVVERGRKATSHGSWSNDVVGVFAVRHVGPLR